MFGSAGKSFPDNDHQRSPIVERSAERLDDRDTGDHAGPPDIATDWKNLQSAVSHSPAGSARGSPSVGAKSIQPLDSAPCAPSPSFDRDPEGIGTLILEAGLAQPHSIVYGARSSPTTDAATIPTCPIEEVETMSPGQPTIPGRNRSRQARATVSRAPTVTATPHPPLPVTALTHPVMWANEIFNGGETASLTDVTTLL